MTVSVVIPFAGDAERARNWDWVRARYAALHPGWEVVQSSPASPWSKGAAVARAVAAASGDVLVVADADSFVAPEQLIRAVTCDAPWVVPFSSVRRLDEADTVALVAMRGEAVPRPRRLARDERAGVPGGGIVVVKREAYESAPLDPRFVGWGGEDCSWGWALDTLVGQHRTLGGPLWHLWHPPVGPKLPDANRLLAVRYRRARGRPAEMVALVAEARATLDAAQSPSGPSTMLS